MLFNTVCVTSTCISFTCNFRVFPRIDHVDPLPMFRNGPGLLGEASAARVSTQAVVKLAIHRTISDLSFAPDLYTFCSN